MRRWLFLLFGVVLVYITLFPTVLRTEIDLRPVWAVELERQSDGPHQGIPGRGERLLPFRNDTRFGYVTDRGQLSYLDSIVYGVTNSVTGFFNYSSIGTDLVFQSPDGTMGARIGTRGYPRLVDDRVFVLATNATRLEEWTTDGVAVWNRDFGALLTTFEVTDTVSLIGLLDGTLQLIDPLGSVVFRKRFDDSRIHAVYGGGLAPGGERFAVIHGMAPQYVSVFEQRDQTYDMIYSAELETDFRRSRLVFLSPDRHHVFVEEEDGVLILRLQNHARFRIPLQGTLIDYGVLESYKLLWFVSTDGARSNLTITTYAGMQIYSQQFDSASIDGLEDHDSLLLTTGERLGMVALGLY